MKMWTFSLSVVLGGPFQGYAQSPPTPQHLAAVRDQSSPDPSAELLARIIGRNLFHPTRGVLPPNGGNGAGSGLPRLLGTMTRPRHNSALLVWDGSPEAESMDEGSEAHGYRLTKVSSSGIELTEVLTKSSHMVMLDGLGGETNRPDSEYAGLLLSNREKAPAPAAVPLKRE